MESAAELGFSSENFLCLEMSIDKLESKHEHQMHQVYHWFKILWKLQWLEWVAPNSNPTQIAGLELGAILQNLHWHLTKTSYEKKFKFVYHRKSSKIWMKNDHFQKDVIHSSVETFSLIFKLMFNEFD
jgi:hypothetical protein